MGEVRTPEWGRSESPRGDGGAVRRQEDGEVRDPRGIGGR